MIPLLNSPECLKQLQGNLSLKKGDQVRRVTGIPPHIRNTILCSQLLTLCSETLVEVNSLTTNIKVDVSQAYAEKAEENGYLTGDR